MDNKIIRIIAPITDGVSHTQGTKIMCGDQEISGVTKVTLIAEVNSVWKAVIECDVIPPAEIAAQVDEDVAGG